MTWPFGMEVCVLNVASLVGACYNQPSSHGSPWLSTRSRPHVPLCAGDAGLGGSLPSGCESEPDWSTLVRIGCVVRSVDGESNPDP